MLSIGKIAAGPAAAAYYADQVAGDPSGYYAGEGEAAGRWVGAGARALDLEGEVSREQLDSVLAGAGQRTVRPGAVGGFDLTFRAPKSVSVLWAIGDPAVAEQLRAGHDAAVAQAMGYIEREACRARRGRGGVVQVRGEGFVSAAFTHRTSRAGDPLLHTHVVTGNLTRGPDGRWTALDGRHLYQQARTAGFLYQAVLRQELTERLGLCWQPVENGVADIDGVSRQVIEHFSQRRREILDRMAERGERSAAAAQVAALDTRRAKQHVPLDRQHADRQARAAEFGLDRDLIRGLIDPGRSLLPPREIDVDALTERASTFTRADVLRAMAQGARDGTSVEALEQRADAVLRQDFAVHVGEDQLKRPRYSTRDLLRVEEGLVRSLHDRRRVWVPRTDGCAVDAAVAARPTIGEDQVQLVRRLCLSADGIDVVRAPAGTGKTFALDAAREVWEQAGHEVLGCALSARAALELEDQAGVPSTTIAWLLHRTDEGHRLPRNGVLVVDEAGMVGTRTLARLAAAAERDEAKLVLVGDDRQLPEIDAGGAFRALAHAAPAAELREGRRQQHPWDRQALEALRSGEVERWAKAYRDAGRVTVAKSADDVRAALVNDWAQAEGDAVMIAHRRSDVADLNARGRALRRANGELGPDEVIAGERAFSVGDRVVATRNEHHAQIVNGQRGTVEDVDLDQLSVRIRLESGAHVEARHSALDGGLLQHGYAITAHRAQGATVDRTFVLGSEDLYREWGYTALSRHRYEARFYVTRSDLGLDADRAPEPDPVAAGLARLLGRSQAEEMAMVQLRQLTDEQLETERARLAERLSASGQPAPTDGPERRMEDLDRRCGHYELRAERLQAERDATSWLKRKERRRLDVALESAASAWARLEGQRLEARAEVERLTGHRDAWLERHGSDAERYLGLDAERQDRHTLRSLADRRLNGLAEAQPRLELPHHDAAIELDGPDLGL